MVERKVAESETEGGGGTETVERKRGGGTEMTRERVLRESKFGTRRLSTT